MFEFLFCENFTRVFFDYMLFEIPRITGGVDHALFVDFQSSVETYGFGPDVQVGDLLMDGDCVLLSANPLHKKTAERRSRGYREGISTSDWIWFRVSIVSTEDVPELWKSMSLHGWRGERVSRDPQQQRSVRRRVEDKILHIELCSEMDQYCGTDPSINEYGPPEAVYMALLDFLQEARTH
jgi:hypothetical protein